MNLIDGSSGTCGPGRSGRRQRSEKPSLRRM